MMRYGGCEQYRSRRRFEKRASLQPDPVTRSGMKEPRETPKRHLGPFFYQLCKSPVLAPAPRPGPRAMNGREVISPNPSCVRTG
ncbi:hypothetical protein NDU88_007464 [Pleurodeles waltl]|uniref:Uncharacterized protein n=1 Tax=Pleurodeles waltl TaxID=8319 RepID=A0AAV7QN63_PLEWA|nr:hypothetical protein NDU88_007464 [Pleurodeles waltl]